MTISNDMNPYAGSTTNKDYEVSTASMRIEGPKKIDNLVINNYKDTILKKYFQI